MIDAVCNFLQHDKQNHKPEGLIMDKKGIYLFKKNGYYYIAYTDKNNGRRKQKSTRCKYKPDAMLVLSDFANFIADAHKVRPIAFSKFTKDFLKYADNNNSMNLNQLL